MNHLKNRNKQTKNKQKHTHRLKEKNVFITKGEK